MFRFRTLIAPVAIALLALPVYAQDDAPPGRRGAQGRGGGQQMQQMTPEQARATWTAQATFVGAHHELDEEKSAKLIETYVKCREETGEAIAKAREEAMQNAGDDRRAAMQAMREATQKINAENQEKFKTALADIYDSQEKIGEAVLTLGSFNQNWDRMVHTVNGFELDDDKSKSAHSAIYEYVKANATASEIEDRQAQREAMNASREKLTETMQGILDEDQFGQFRRTMGRAGRGGRGGDGAAGGGGRGGAGGAGGGGHGGAGGGAGGRGGGGRGGGGRGGAGGGGGGGF